MKKRAGLLVCVSVAVSMTCSIASFAADSLLEAVREGKVSGQLRVYHWERLFDDATDWKSSVYGGRMSYETAPISGFSAGLGFRFQDEFATYDDYDDYYYFFYGPDKKNNEAPLVGVSEAFLRYSGYDTVATVGRQYLDTPYLGRSDWRLLQKAFQGVSVTNKSIEKWQFNAGFFTDWVDWHDGDFKDIIGSLVTDEYGQDEVEDGKGVWYASAVWEPVRGITTDLWYYAFTDTYQIIAPSIKWYKYVNPDLSGFVDLRFSKFDGIGDELLNGTDRMQDYDTYTAGAIFGTIYKHFTTILFLQKTGDQDPIERYESRRGVSAMINWCQWAEEDAIALAFKYNFAGFNFPELTVSTMVAYYNTPDGENDPNHNQDHTEYDLTFEYKFAKTVLNGLIMRASLGYRDSDDDQASLHPLYLYYPSQTEDCTEIRLELEYNF